jgi:hypothetical protein
MAEKGRQVDPDLESFQKRAVELMAHKFVSDYRMAMSQGHREELEHFYEMWSYSHIREIALREQVWRCALIRLRERQK